jgi:winged helix DNA-binding protein
VTTLSWDGVLAWRMRRQFLDPRGADGVLEIARALCGVQAQVASAAELAVALRRRTPQSGGVSDALSARRLIRTWAMRGTLHVLAPDQAGAFLALVGALRSWERGAWQRTFGITATEIQALAATVTEVLNGRVLERDELIEEIATRTGNRDLDEHLRSGWGGVLKPLAWMGLLCNGPSRGNRVTFTSPASWLDDWSGIPEPDAAARIAIPAYLSAYGPARIETFDAWLTRGRSPKAEVRRWFDSLGDELVIVDVEGKQGYIRACDLDELEATGPSDAVRLLGGFDQYVLGPGTDDPVVVPAARRKLVSKAAGWIAPVVLRGGRVVGTWEPDGDVLTVSLFEDAGTIDGDALEAEAARVGACLGREPRLAVARV